VLTLQQLARSHGHTSVAIPFIGGQVPPRSCCECCAEGILQIFLQRIGTTPDVLARAIVEAAIGSGSGMNVRFSLVASITELSTARVFHAAVHVVLLAEQHHTPDMRQLHTLTSSARLVTFLPQDTHLFQTIVQEVSSPHLLSLAQTTYKNRPVQSVQASPLPPGTDISVLQVHRPRRFHGM
jgi:hypothetical protein